MIELVAAEWLKLTTTRLLFGMTAAAVTLSAAGVAGMVLSHDAGVPLGSSEGVRRALSVTGTGAVLVLVLGVLIAAGEYRHGTAADTFLTTPRRHLVLVAKLIVGAVVGLAAGVLTFIACIAVAGLLYRREGVAFPLADVEVRLALAGTLVYTSLFSVLGVALGSLVRNQVVAVAGALAWLGIVEHTVVNLLPAVGRWLPAAAGQAIVRTPLDGLLPPVAGAVLLAAYASAIAATGLRVSVTRDA